MTAALFYVEAVPEVGAAVLVDGDEGFHAASVRRVRPGERLLVSDGNGAVAECVVEAADKRSLTARVQRRSVLMPPRPAVTVVQAIPKSDRSELAVELATEAGADEFVAWQAGRCVARWDGERAQKGIRRWRAVARSAARQSRRARIPPVSGPMTGGELADYVAARVGDGAAALVLHESAVTGLAESHVAHAESIVLMVGPEGGIGEEELTALSGAGAVPVRLGPTVLRTSTAAAVALGALGVLAGRWR